MPRPMSKARRDALRQHVKQYHDERRRWYPVNSDGQEVRPGDVVTSFRGENATFEYVTGFPEGSKEGKVFVRWAKGGEGEHYPSVFDLRLVRRET